MSLDTGAHTGPGGDHAGNHASSDPTAAPMAIEVRGIDKRFRIPTHRISRLKERLVRPFSRLEFRELHALRDVSFDIHRGEFFGILGRNGSGKSTLLKVMAGIYRADSGTVRMAGRVAPFIELGVGFDMELSARENVVLNGVMMGLTPREARRSLDQVVEFAELQEFVDMKLKNYSSGMLVRLGFSVMVQADTDILLIDEVLAVGDAAFQQKCADVFRQMRKRGKTIVLVTHDIAAVEEYCHRAMLLSNGSMIQIGDPGEVARRYLRVNFEQLREEPEVAGTDATDVRLLDVWIEDEKGERVNSVEQDGQIRIRASLEAVRPVPGAQFGFIVGNPDGVNVHEFMTTLSRDAEVGADLAPGERATITVAMQNALSPGRYFLHFGVSRNRNSRDVVLYTPHVLGFVVFGDRRTGGIVAAPHQMTVETETGSG